MRRSRSILRALIRDGEREITEAQPDFVGVGILSLGVERRHDRGKHAALQPRRWFSIRTERYLEIHRRHRMECVELDIVLAAPNDLHGLARFLRKHRSFHNEIRERLASERSA